MDKIYDLAIIGSGIAGSMVAFWSKKLDKDIVVLDKSKVPASGGSGAAGAFIAPKLGKNSPLTKLTNDAFKFSTNFYVNYFKDYFTQSGMIRFAKDEDDIKNLNRYLDTIGEGELIDANRLKELGVIGQEIGLYFSKGGVCDAISICKDALDRVDYVNVEVKDIIDCQDYYLIEDKIKAKIVVFATGYEGFRGFEYMGISGLWGSRGDYYSLDSIKSCMHKSVSVSSNIDGVIKIGATINRDKNPCISCNRDLLSNLELKAKEIANIDNIELKEIFCGYRANSRDYFPIVGRVIDADIMIQKYPQIKKGYKKAPLMYKKDWYILNGLGSRGYVFAPYLAKNLVDFIFNGSKLIDVVNSDRLFLKWVRRLNT